MMQPPPPPPVSDRMPLSPIALDSDTDSSAQSQSENTSVITSVTTTTKKKHKNGLNEHQKERRRQQCKKNKQKKKLSRSETGSHVSPSLCGSILKPTPATNKFVNIQINDSDVAAASGLQITFGHKGPVMQSRTTARPRPTTSASTTSSIILPHPPTPEPTSTSSSSPMPSPSVPAIPYISNPLAASAARKPRWTCHSCGYANTLRREDCKICESNKPTDLPLSPLFPTPAPPAASPTVKAARGTDSVVVTDDYTDFPPPPLPFTTISPSPPPRMPPSTVTYSATNVNTTAPTTNRPRLFSMENLEHHKQQMHIISPSPPAPPCKRARRESLGAAAPPPRPPPPSTASSPMGCNLLVGDLPTPRITWSTAVHNAAPAGHITPGSPTQYVMYSCIAHAFITFVRHSQENHLMVQQKYSDIIDQAANLFNHIDNLHPGGSWDPDQATQKLNGYLFTRSEAPFQLTVLHTPPFISTQVFNPVQMEIIFGHLEHLASNWESAGVFISKPQYHQGKVIICQKDCDDSGEIPIFPCYLIGPSKAPNSEQCTVISLYKYPDPIAAAQRFANYYKVHAHEDPPAYLTVDFFIYDQYDPRFPLSSTPITGARTVALPASTAVPTNSIQEPHRPPAPTPRGPTHHITTPSYFPPPRPFASFTPPPPAPTPDPPSDPLRFHKIGIDIGGVLMQRHHQNDVPWEYSKTHEIPNAWSSIATLARVFGSSNIYFVSYAGWGMEHKIRIWMMMTFEAEWKATGIPASNLLFVSGPCTTKGQRKAEKILQHRIEVMIDDDLANLQDINNAAPRTLCYWFGPTRSLYKDCPARVTCVSNWTDTLLAIRKDSTLPG